MFIVGMEFRIEIVRSHWRSSLAVSAAGMVTPFLLGAALAWLFFSQTHLFQEKTTLYEAMLFLGASMCITAFPMLARIIHFKGLTGTRMGTVAIGAGAMDDATAWCLLALVLASIDGDPIHAAWSILGGVGFVVVALGVVRPIFSRYKRLFVDDKGDVSELGFVVALAAMSAGASFTDWIHLHAVFGAFLIGTTIPRGEIQRQITARMQPLVVALMLPLFFTYSGLNTKITLLNSWALWGACGLVLLAAILGKGVACWAAALASGIPRREALGIGALMNARGLMELIIINIGLQRQIISEELFAALVIMAIVTTLMASPIFEWLVRDRPSAPEPTPPANL